MAKALAWTPQAVRSYNEVMAFLMERWTLREARHFDEELDEVPLLIARFPRMYRRGLANNVREAFLPPHILLIYRVKRNGSNS